MIKLLWWPYNVTLYYYLTFVVITIEVGFHPKLISLEFRWEFWSKIIRLSTKFLVEIIESNRNFDFDFDGRNRNSDKQSNYKCWFISVKNALKFRHWYRNIVPKSELRCRIRNSYSKIEIRIGISMSKSKPKFRFWHQNRNRNSDFDIKILTKSEWNFVGISISSKVNNQNRKRNRDSDFDIEISENQNIEILTKLG
jgi:hypothetical protein